MAAAVATAAAVAAAAAAAAVGPPVGGSLAAASPRPIAVVGFDLTAIELSHLVIAGVRFGADSGVVIGGFGLGGDDKMMMMMKGGVMAVVALGTGTSPHHGMRRIPFDDAALFDAVDRDD